MKIAVVAANGKAGKLIVEEAVARGHEVTAIVRGENKTKAQNAIIKDLFDIEAADLAGFDVVFDAFGIFDPEKFDQHTTSLMHLCDAVANTNTRLLVVGGAGSLYVDPGHTIQLKDTPEFPDIFVPLSTAQTEELAALRQRNDVRWTFVSPAADFQPEGERTGKYLLAGDELTPNTAGESIISYADYALAMVDEAERTDDAHIQERISVVRA
jgi:hypothetical protein